jgi:hypothetical protein
MSARIFISYRASDGADKATALARDLDARFGADQIFLDKDDLPAGSRWRDAISSALHDCPVLLVLVTPHYLGAVDAGGKRCIEREDDPARAELSAGIAAQAHIVPLLCDGVDAMPSGSTLPKPFDQLSELQWARLRAYDWREDLGRLADDLRRLGVAPIEPPAGAAQPATTPIPLADEIVAGQGDTAGKVPARRLVLGATAGVALLAAGGWGLWRWRRQRAADLSGPWSARIGARGAPSSRDGQQVVLLLDQIGRNLKLTSSAVDIQRDPDWENHRDFWRRRNGTELRRVFYRGEGRILGDDEDLDDSADEAASGAAPKSVPVRRIVVAMRVFAPGVDGESIDGGSLRGTVDLDAQRIHGRLRLDSEDTERVVDVKRGN